ncbi:MAG TPA: hypothetical protein PK151_05185 [Caldisericia bacterium]|nr:hypothetical protein [Caldisericia bacterium]
MFDKKTFTYGYEIEWGDVDRRIEIPKELGKWEYCETDIVNMYGEYKGIACDPLGIEPFMGGEINTMPTKTWQEQVDLIMKIKDIFLEKGNNPSASCVSHGHIHIFIPGLKDNISALKKLMKYIMLNQDISIEKCYNYQHNDEITKMRGTSYLKYDGGRRMPEYMIDNILNKTENFSDFIRMHCAGKDGVSLGRPFRYAINTYNLKHIGTIEFRLFRSSIDRNEIEDSFRFVEMFMDSALNDGDSVEEIFKKNTFNFPKFVWNSELYEGWVKTKYPKERGTKKREFVDLDYVPKKLPKMEELIKNIDSENIF